MYTLPGIESAVGLNSDDKAALSALLNVYSTVSSRNARLRDYFEGDSIAEEIGVDALPPSVDVKECCSWPKKAVASVSERSRFDGFVFEGGYKDDALARVVRDNCLTASYGRHVPSELMHGCMFATVGRVGLSTSVRFHTAETAAAIWDSSEGRIGCGFVIASLKRTQWSPNQPVPTVVNLHMPGYVTVLSRTGASTWFATQNPTPIGRPMMESFAFRGTGVKPFGESRISKNVMDIADDVVRTLRYMAVSAAFYAKPQMYILGLTDEQFDELSKDKWSTAIGAMVMSTRDGDGNIPDFGQIAATSPQPYIDLLRTYAMMFSGATGVPLNSLGIVQDNPSSAEAIAAAREDICIAARDLNDSNGESLRNVALMAMAVAENKTIGALTDEQKSVMAHFDNPSMPSVVSQADAATKIASVDAGFAGTRVFYEMLGFDAATIERIEGEKKKAQASSAIAALLAPKEVPDGDTAQPAGRAD